MAENRSDSSRPNAGRIYDYFLGGYHNFGEVQRVVGFLMRKSQM